MLPAYQGLKAYQLHIFQRVDWLVIKPEFVISQRAADFSFLLKTAERAFVHAGVKNHIAGPAILFRLVHGTICVTQHIFDRITPGVNKHDAQASTGKNILPSNGERGY